MPKASRPARTKQDKADEISRENEKMDTLTRVPATCPDCGGTTIDAMLKIGVDQVYVETISHKMFQPNVSQVICEVCEQCGRIFLYAKDLSIIRRALQ